MRFKEVITEAELNEKFWGDLSSLGADTLEKLKHSFMGTLGSNMADGKNNNLTAATSILHSFYQYCGGSRQKPNIRAVFTFVKRGFGENDFRMFRNAIKADLKNDEELPRKVLMDYFRDLAAILIHNGEVTFSGTQKGNPGEQAHTDPVKLVKHDESEQHDQFAQLYILSSQLKLDLGKLNLHASIPPQIMALAQGTYGEFLQHTLRKSLPASCFKAVLASVVQSKSDTSPKEANYIWKLKLDTKALETRLEKTNLKDATRNIIKKSVEKSSTVGQLMDRLSLEQIGFYSDTMKAILASAVRP